MVCRKPPFLEQAEDYRQYVQPCHSGSGSWQSMAWTSASKRRLTLSTYSSIGSGPKLFLPVDFSCTERFFHCQTIVGREELLSSWRTRCFRLGVLVTVGVISSFSGRHRHLHPFRAQLLALRYGWHRRLQGGVCKPGRPLFRVSACRACLLPCRLATQANSLLVLCLQQGAQAPQERKISCRIFPSSG